MPGLLYIWQYIMPTCSNKCSEHFFPPYIIPSIRLPRCSHCDPYRIAAMPETKLKGPKKILEWDQRQCTRHPDNSRFTRNLHSSPDMNRLQWKPHLARTLDKSLILFFSRRNTITAGEAWGMNNRNGNSFRGIGPSQRRAKQREKGKKKKQEVILMNVLI